MTTFPICVAEDGHVTHPDKLPYDPYALPWVTGAEDTLPERTRRAYPSGRSDLQEKLKHLKSKRAHIAAPRSYAWAVGAGAYPNIDNDDEYTYRGSLGSR